MSKGYIAKKLKEYREKNDITVNEIAEHFGKSVKTIYSWESGKGQPDADSLIELCLLYHIDSFSVLNENAIVRSTDEKLVFNKNEHQHIKKYRKLDAYGKEMVDMVLDKEYGRVSDQRENEKTSILRLVGRDGSSVTKEVNTAETDAIFAQLDGKETKDDF